MKISDVWVARTKDPWLESVVSDVDLVTPPSETNIPFSPTPGI